MSAFRRHTLLAAQLGAAFAVLSLALGGALLAGRQLAARQAASLERVRHTYDLLRGVDRVLTDVLDVETGSRGFVVSGSERFLEPYERALRAMAADQARVRELARGNAAQQHGLEVLDRQIAAKLDFTAATVEARRLDATAAEGMLRTERGKQLMDEVRRSVAAIQEKEQRALVERVEQERADEQRSERLRWALAGLAMLACAGGCAAVLRQLAARARAEAALAASEERFHLASEGTSDGIWDWDVGTGRVLFSAQWKAMLGYAPAELRDDFAEWQSRVHPDDLPLAQAALAEFLAGRTERLVMEHRLRHRDGEYRWILSRGLGRRDAAGALTRAVGAHTDVTRHKRLEAALREEERRLATLMANVPGMVYRCRNDKDWSMEFVSEGSLALTGYRPSSFAPDASGHTAMPYASIIHVDDQPPVWDEVQAALAERRPFRLGYRIRTCAGEERCVTEYGRGIVDDQGALVALEGLVVDTSVQRQLEDALHQRTQELVRSNEELERFASVASHDLQEPLRKIQAFGDRLAARCGDTLGEQGQDYLQRMRAAATRMRTLIDALLGYSRLRTHAVPVGDVDLGAIAEAVVSDLETRLADSGGRLTVGALPAVRADAVQMRQLLQNLIGNALKFRRPDATPDVTVSAALQVTGGGGVVRLEVRDNGIGFDEKYLDRIFAPFQRLHGRSEYDGTGMGLAICQRIVERHGGTLTARSTPGVGSTFIATLPAGAAPTRAAA